MGKLYYIACEMIRRKRQDSTRLYKYCRTVQRIEKKIIRYDSINRYKLFISSAKHSADTKKAGTSKAAPADYNLIFEKQNQLYKIDLLSSKVLKRENLTIENLILISSFLIESNPATILPATGLSLIIVHKTLQLL